MKKIHAKIMLILLLFPLAMFGQNDSIPKPQNKQTFKKRVLSATELNILSSYYEQDGQNASVTGGIGSEDLKDIATNINIAIPINADDVFSIDFTVSAYTSASSSNLNPFSGASKGGDDDDDDNDDDKQMADSAPKPVTGSPWVTSSGASVGDLWLSGNFAYTHSSDDRNTIYNTHLSISNEYDYFSLGGGLGLTRLFNQQNTELSVGATVYLDTWRPEYPTEIKTYIKENGNLNADFFNGVPILDSNGNAINKNGPNAWRPQKDYLIKDKGRNTYALSLSFSQILSQRMQVSIFSDVTYQKGWLANPMQRVYFADVPDFYIGKATDIPHYTSPQNTQVFQLADDIERLPDSRLKIPVGMRLHYYINEYLVLKTYYRYYYDDWGIRSHTFNIELPVKISQKFTLYPNYRFYNQTAADYFAPYEQHLSTDTFYTSDYDLSAFTANQFGFGIKYNDIFTSKHIWKMGLKSLTLNYHHYYKDNNFRANIVSLGATFVMDK